MAAYRFVVYTAVCLRLKLLAAPRSPRWLHKHRESQGLIWRLHINFYKEISPQIQSPQIIRISCTGKTDNGEEYDILYLLVLVDILYNVTILKLSICNLILHPPWVRSDVCYYLVTVLSQDVFPLFLSFSRFFSHCLSFCLNPSLRPLRIEPRTSNMLDKCSVSPAPT